MNKIQLTLNPLGIVILYFHEYIPGELLISNEVMTGNCQARNIYSRPGYYKFQYRNLLNTVFDVICVSPKSYLPHVDLHII